MQKKNDVSSQQINSMEIDVAQFSTKGNKNGYQDLLKKRFLKKAESLVNL